MIESADNPFFISTYAYSLLLQNKPDESCQNHRGLKTGNIFKSHPWFLPYYGVIEAQTGHKDLAREPLATRAEKGKLLREEKQMVQFAMGR